METLDIDEMDVIAEAFEQAVAALGLDIGILDSVEIGLLRSVVILTAARHRRDAPRIYGDKVLSIVHDAVRLFGIVR